MKLSKFGGAPLEVRYDALIFDLAVDRTSLYYANGDGIVRITPK